MVVLALLGAGMVFADRISSAADNSLYADEVIFSRNTPYQRIVLTKWKDDLRLFLNSHLQFSSRDEYRYHEALVHPGLAALPGARRVLVLGGGDGLAVREILKYPSVESITLVDLDPEMTRLFSTHPVLSALNQHSLTAPRVHVINADAFRWLDTNTEQFDFIVADFPDPTSYALGKLYTTAFYRLAAKHLASGGLMVVQSTSPLFARQSYWCIVESVKQAGLARLSVSRVCAIVRRMGIRDRQLRALSSRRANCRPDCASFDHQRRRAVRISGRHAARAGRTEPAERPGAGALLRTGMEGHRALDDSRAANSSAAPALIGLWRKTIARSPAGSSTIRFRWAIGCAIARRFARRRNSSAFRS